MSDSESPLYVGGSGRSAPAVSEFHHVALGHLHGPQKAGANGRYSGSPLCYSFDEVNQKKGYTVVTIENETVRYEQVPVVPMRPMRVLTASFDQLMAEGKKPPCEDYVFLMLTDDKPVFMPVDQLRDYYPNLLGLSSQWLKSGGLQGLTGEQQGAKRNAFKSETGKRKFSARSFQASAKARPPKRIRELFDRILAQVGGGGKMTPVHLTMQAFGPYQDITEISFSQLEGKLF